MIQGTFLLLLAVLGYGLFFAFQKPITHPVTESEILQFITCFGAIVVTIFFWGILANTLSMLFRNMWMGIGSSLLIWVATNSTGGDKLFGAWNLFSYSFRDIENTADITWLYGKGLEELKTKELATGMEYVLQILESEQVNECYMHLEADGYVGDLY